MSRETFEGVFNGVNVSVFREFGNHRFSDEECETLLNGGWVKFQAESRSGREYEAVGHLVLDGKYARFALDYNKAPVELLVPDEWSGHQFSEQEKHTLATGGTVYCTDLVSSKTGKWFSGEVVFSIVQGKRRIQLLKR